MKTQLKFRAKHGFTLVELLVAMAITTIIVTVLVSVTSVALDTFNRSRSELRASRQAKAMIDAMARDFESLVTRSGNKNEWLYATNSDPSTIGGKLKSTSASKLIFFTAAIDRYNGEIGTAKDKGGDVSCVAYNLTYSDPISEGGTNFDTFVLNRMIVNPDVTFSNLLGKENLADAFQQFNTKLVEPINFICENIYQFTVTFNLQLPDLQDPTKLVSVPIKVGPTEISGNTVKQFVIAGNELKISGDVTGYTALQLKGAKVTAITVAATAISDFGIDQLRTREFGTPSKKSEFLAKNSYQYSKTVQISSR